MGLFRGLWAPFRGALFVARHRLWGHILLPVGLNVALAIAAARVATHVVSTRLGYEGFLEGLATVLVAILLFIFAQPVVCAPFVDLLTERVETIVTGSHPRTGFVTSAMRSIWHGLLKSLLYAFALAVTAALFLLTAVGGAIGTAMMAIFLAYDGFDYPLARRINGFWAKWRYLVVHPGLTLGYAAGATVLYLIPLAAILAPPFAAVGATLAFLDTEGQRLSKAPDSGAPAVGEKGGIT